MVRTVFLHSPPTRSIGTYYLSTLPMKRFTDHRRPFTSFSHPRIHLSPTFPVVTLHLSTHTHYLMFAISLTFRFAFGGKRTRETYPWVEWQWKPVRSSLPSPFAFVVVHLLPAASAACYSRLRRVRPSTFSPRHRTPLPMAMAFKVSSYYLSRTRSLQWSGQLSWRFSTSNSNGDSFPLSQYYTALIPTAHPDFFCASESTIEAR
ncbi:hypothetical protein R3P38DRAFT_3026176 [Favolaschia claudopus]|uniref:Uncharacterized protein n=1 Tax=Favolaschia claudopus TaxID=2862362 RepID=A0AAW0AEI7_9AGAR